ncbi:MAG: methylglyoxal synthase [Clostridia bacterium]|jgi:methylglyoxal synthase|nr:methylglyoxal synthase [Clostridia bacterium]
MKLAILAHDSKKELLAQFCSAYCGILSQHTICATSVTAKYIVEATGLEVDELMSGESGGNEQIAQRIAYDEIDMLIAFRETSPSVLDDISLNECLRLCDYNNIPYATNLGTAEALIIALGRGDIDWRKYRRIKPAGLQF